MPRCFWTLCTCPDTQPCPEHTGLNCSIVNGVVVTRHQDVNDASTHDADLALAAMDADATRLRALQNRLETRLRALEQEKRDIEAAATAAADRARRRAAVDRAQRATDSVRNLDDEVRTIERDLDMLERSWRWQGNAMALLLIRPYADPTGYCACYTRKLQRLAQVDGRFAAEMATIARVTASMNQIQSQMQPGFMQFTAAKAGPSFLAILTILAFIWFGTLKAAAIALLIGLIVIAILLLGLIIYMVSIKAEMLAAQRRLLTLYLLYYRVQQIPTCQQPSATGTGEEDWWRDFLETLRPVSGLPPPEGQ